MYRCRLFMCWRGCMNNDYYGDFKASILFPNAPLQSFGPGVIIIRVLWEVVGRQDSNLGPRDYESERSSGFAATGHAKGL
jgi:hypothetical protein